MMGRQLLAREHNYTFSAMSTRLIRKQTGLTYEPPNAPGIVVEYTLHPEQPFKPATRDNEGQEYIPARVEVETVTVGNLTDGQSYALIKIAQYLEDLAETDGRQKASELATLARTILSTKPANLLPWLQTYGADEDEVCERLAEGLRGITDETFLRQLPGWEGWGVVKRNRRTII